MVDGKAIFNYQPSGYELLCSLLITADCRCQGCHLKGAFYFQIKASLPKFGILTSRIADKRAGLCKKRIGFFCKGGAMDERKEDLQLTE